MEEPFEIPCLPPPGYRHRAESENERSLLRVTQMLAAQSGLDSGLPDPRACETFLGCCQGPGQPGLPSFCKAWQAGYCSWTQGWTCSMGWGSPRPGCWGPGPLGKARSGSLVVSMALFARAPSPGLAHLPQTGLRPQRPSPSSPGPLRGPVVCSVEWKNPTPAS